MTGNNESFLSALREEGYFPPMDAPLLSRLGGNVSAGEMLTLQNPNQSGAIYYTTDGSDPRSPTGEVSASAMAFNDTIAIDQSMTLRTRVVDGETWSALTEARFVVPEATSLVITEIMYNPPGPTDIEVAAGITENDAFEFVEIYNRGNAPVDLTNFEFVDGIELTFPETILEPDSYGVIVKSPNAFRQRYGSDIEFIGSYTGQLNNGGEQIRLVDPVGNVALDFEYGDNSLWAQSADGAGASLELISNESPLDQLGKYYRWHGSHQFGGSPGSEGASRSDIRINEVLSNSGNQLDAIELINDGSTSVDIGGWFLSDTTFDLHKFTVPLDTVLPPGGVIVFNESDFNDPSSTAGFALSGNRGDDLWLTRRDTAGEVLFEDDVHFPRARGR